MFLHKDKKHNGSQVENKQTSQKERDQIGADDKINDLMVIGQLFTLPVKTKLESFD